MVLTLMIIMLVIISEDDTDESTQVNNETDLNKTD